MVQLDLNADSSPVEFIYIWQDSVQWTSMDFSFGVVPSSEKVGWSLQRGTSAKAASDASSHPTAQAHSPLRLDIAMDPDYVGKRIIL